MYKNLIHDKEVIQINKGSNSIMMPKIQQNAEIMDYLVKKKRLFPYPI